MFSQDGLIFHPESLHQTIPVLSALDVPVNASAIDSALFTVLPLLGTKFVSIDCVPIVELLEFLFNHRRKLHLLI